jgi:hypothetical protein
MTPVQAAGVLVPGVPTYDGRTMVDRAPGTTDLASTTTTGSAPNMPIILPVAHYVPPVLGRGSHRQTLPFRFHWLESLIDQILYIANFDAAVADPLVPPCEHFIDIVCDNLNDFNSCKVPSEIDNLCFDNDDNVSNNVYTEFDTTFVDNVFLDSGIVHTNTNHMAYGNVDNVATISRIVHTNTNHDNVDNATVCSRVVSTKFCDNFIDNGDDNIDSGIVYTNTNHVS